MKCAHCGKPHNRRKFCSNRCKDRFHNKHNPRGYGLDVLIQTQVSDEDAALSDPNYADHCAGLDAMESGWDGHKEAF
jgi:hypothetical protein